jgi:hypothetical protein
MKNQEIYDNTIKEQTNNRVEVDVTPKAYAVWKTLGTEYLKSFSALKELIDNSVSAAYDKKCKVKITLEEISDLDYKVSIEDNAGGVQDPSMLLTIATDSNDKKGRYNYYGYGLKNALAYFQPKWHLSRWFIQSKTLKNIEDGKLLEVNAPYVYNNEFNEEYNHKGMNVRLIDIENYKGSMSSHEPSTYIEFQTPRNKFNNLHPLKKGRKSTNIISVVQDLSDLISLYYRPLFMDNMLDVEISYCENDGKRKFKTLMVKVSELPTQEVLHTYNGKLTNNGGKLSVESKWFVIDRDTDSPYVFAQERGLLLYVNGILVEPYKWEEGVFGGNVYHPSLNSLGCYVEVKGPKSATPELSVSKTKIQETGENYQCLVNLLNQQCPTNKIDQLKNSSNTTDETVKRDRYFEGTLSNWSSEGFISNLQKERLLTLPEGKGNESLRADIFYSYSNQKKICIMELKKERINSSSVGQIINYYHILKIEFPEHEIELKLVSDTCQETAKQLINMYKQNGINISFHSFASLGL